jgi:GTPase SAR1 family protein
MEPNNVKLKVLVYGLSGTGKTMWASTAPNPGYAACETGAGQGLLTIADKGIDYVAPTSLTEFEQVAAGAVFKDKDTIILDSLSEMVKSFIKDFALSIPRKQGDSEKRRKGVPELDDYGVMGEITRRLIRKLIEGNKDKHVIVTATERYLEADPESGQGQALIGPDLPGQMFLGSVAMFDLVLRLRTKQILKVPGDAKSRVVQRYFITQSDGAGTLAKCRNNVSLKPLLDKEEVFDLETGQGTFPFLLDKVQKGYQEALKK